MSAGGATEGVSPPFAPYGDAAASLLGEALDVLEPSIPPAVDRFYREINLDPGPNRVLARLSPHELDRLKSHQIEHLAWLLGPTLDKVQNLERGREVGHVHSMVAVEIDWYARAVARYQTGIVESLVAWATPTHRLALHQLITTRLVDELEGVLRGYRDVEDQQLRTLLTIGQVVIDAETVADLARGVLDNLARLEGIAAGSFGRPDNEQRFQFEVAVGNGMELFTSGESDVAPPITTLTSHPSGQGPGGRAWRSGKIEGSDSYLSDPTTRAWHEIGAQNGWRSSIAVPLSGPDGEHRALLSLYAAWPGYFTHSSRSAFIVQLRQILEPALARLESRSGAGSNVITYSARSAHLEKLRSGQVVMVYQPIVELATGRLLKLEALARLGQEGELVSPTEFLPAFGDTELLKLFEIGLDQALAALATWEQQGLTTGVSLNLPASCSADRRYVGLVEAALDRTGVAPSRLTLELLENGSVEGEPDKRFHGLDDLRTLGVRLAEDDLGSGYSSLLRLRNMTFDEVKIDQELVRGAEVAPRTALHFIQPLTSLARSMGLTIAVEGLESAGLVEAAVFLGADAGQGYAIARPLALAAVPQWAATFHLTIDHARPRTALGGLAAHLVWENRLALLAPGPGLLRRAARISCPLSAYINGCDNERAALQKAHITLHTVTLSAPGTDAYDRAWARLEALLIGASLP